MASMLRTASQGFFSEPGGNGPLDIMNTTMVVASGLQV